MYSILENQPLIFTIADENSSHTRNQTLTGSLVVVGASALRLEDMGLIPSSTQTKALKESKEKKCSEQDKFACVLEQGT